MKNLVYTKNKDSYWLLAPIPTYLLFIFFPSVTIDGSDWTPAIVSAVMMAEIQYFNRRFGKLKDSLCRQNSLARKYAHDAFQTVNWQWDLFTGHQSAYQFAQVFACSIGVWAVKNHKSLAECDLGYFILVFPLFVYSFGKLERYFTYSPNSIYYWELEEKNSSKPHS